MKTWALIAAAGLFLQAKDRPQDGDLRRTQGAGPDVGKAAPAFKLKTQDGQTEVELAKLKGRPALFVFGSYT